MILTLEEIEKLNNIRQDTLYGSAIIINKTHLIFLISAHYRGDITYNYLVHSNFTRDVVVPIFAKCDYNRKGDKLIIYSSKCSADSAKTYNNIKELVKKESLENKEIILKADIDYDKQTASALMEYCNDFFEKMKKWGLIMKLTKENIERICSKNPEKLNGSMIKVSDDECYLIVTAWYED